MTYKIGTIGEFMAWTKRVVRDPKAAQGKPKRWFDGAATAKAALAQEVSPEALVKLLSPQNLRMLSIMAQKRPQSVRELADLMRRKQTSVSRTLKRLNQAGIVTMTRGKGRTLKLALVATRVRLEVDLTGAAGRKIAVRPKAAA